jgi:hypothetical protein
VAWAWEEDILKWEESHPRAVDMKIHLVEEEGRMANHTVVEVGGRLVRKRLARISGLLLQVLGRPPIGEENELVASEPS